jgi:hypothetical protein
MAAEPVRYRAAVPKLRHRLLDCVAAVITELCERDLADIYRDHELRRGAVSAEPGGRDLVAVSISVPLPIRWSRSLRPTRW